VVLQGGKVFEGRNETSEKKKKKSWRSFPAVSKPLRKKKKGTKSGEGAKKSRLKRRITGKKTKDMIASEE